MLLLCSHGVSLCVIGNLILCALHFASRLLTYQLRFIVAPISAFSAILPYVTICAFSSLQELAGPVICCQKILPCCCIHLYGCSFVRSPSVSAFLSCILFFCPLRTFSKWPSTFLFIFIFIFRQFDIHSQTSFVVHNLRSPSSASLTAVSPMHY